MLPPSLQSTDAETPHDEQTPVTRGLEGNRARVLEIIRERALLHRPATVREMAEMIGLSSPASIHRHLRRLEQMGLIERDPDAGSRNWHPVGPVHPSPTRSIPVVGRIAAGEPIESYADQGTHAQESIQIPPDAFGSGPNVVALKVEGLSMQDAGILPGDLAIVRRQPTVENGEIAAVTLDGEGTLKTWRIGHPGAGEGQGAGHVRLEAANSLFDDIQVDPDRQSIEVFGKLIGVIRHYDRR